MSVKYIPSSNGGWVLVVAGHAALIVNGAGDRRLVTTLWDALHSADPAEAALEAVTRRGLTSAPPFAMAIWSGAVGSDAVVLARGDAGAIVTSAGARTTVDATSFSTWTEQRIANASDVRLGAWIAASAKDALPIQDGVVLAAGAEFVIVPNHLGYSTSGTGALGDEPAALAHFLEFENGRREPLSDSVLIGRAPSVSKVSSGEVPRLIAIPGNDDISRNHAQISRDGTTVFVTDLYSRNGTSVILPGMPSRTLRGGDPMPVIPGTVLDLGGSVVVTIIAEQTS